MNISKVTSDKYIDSMYLSTFNSPGINVYTQLFRRVYDVVWIGADMSVLDSVRVFGTM